MNYDKPRIASTVVIGIILTVCLIVSLYSFLISGSLVQEILSNNKGGAIIAFIVTMPVYLIAGAAVIIASIISLVFAILNRKSTLKAIRGIAIAYDVLSGLLIVSWIVITVVFFVVLQK